MWSVLFGDRDRIDRGAYAAAGLLTFGLFVFATLLVLLPIGSANYVLRAVLNGVALAVALYGLTYFGVSTVRRLRDVGVPTWLSLLLLIPGVSWVLFWLVLSLIPGQDRRVAS